MIECLGRTKMASLTSQIKITTLTVQIAEANLIEKQTHAKSSGSGLEVEHPLCIQLKAGHYCLGGSNPARGNFYELILTKKMH